MNTHSPKVETLAAAVGMLVPPLLALLFIHNYALNIPFSDQWSNTLTVAEAVQQGTWGPETLFIHTNGHYVLPLRALTLFSAWAWDWHLAREVYINFWASAAVIGLLVWLLRRHHAGWWRGLGVPISALVFSLVAFEIWIYSETFAWLSTLLAFLLALGTVYTGPARGGRLALAAGWAALATFSSAHGLLTWWVILGGLVWMGYRPWLWGALSVLFTALFVTASTGETAQAITWLPLPEWGDYLRFGLMHLGTPFSPWFFEPDLSALVGALGLGAFGLGWLWAWRLRIPPAKLVLWGSLAGFALLTAALIIPTRYTPDMVTAVNSRYAITVNLFWLAVAGLAWQVRAARGWAWVYVPLGGVVVAAYLYANLFVVQVMADEFGRWLRLDAPPLSPAEQCVRDLPLQANPACLTNIPIDAYDGPPAARERAVYRMAAGGLAVFAEVSPRPVLAPWRHTPDEGLWLDSPSEALNAYMRRVYLADEAPRRDPRPERLWHFRHPDAPDALSLADYQPAHVSDAALFGIDTAWEVIRWSEVSADPAYRFDDFALYDWTLSGYRLAACEALHTTSVWQRERPTDAAHWLTFVLIQPDSGAILAASDSPPGNRPSETWQPGAYYLDLRTLNIPCEADPGEYMLLAGVYQPDPLRDAAITRGDGTPVTGNRAFLTTIQVTR